MAKGVFTCCVLGLVGAAIVAERVDPLLLQPAVPVAAVAPVAAPVPVAIENFAGDVALRRAADGYFYADAQVNGSRLRLLVDTGASGVVLTRADAQRAGIAAGDYSASGVGAGGTVRLMPVMLDRVAVGTLSAANVPAMVAEGDALPVSLLGQSWLARLGSVTIEGDAMVLR